MTDQVIVENLGWFRDMMETDQCPKVLIFVPDTKSMNKVHSWLFCSLLDIGLDPDMLLDKVCGASSSHHKSDTLHRFCSGHLKVVVCTSVWGSGIDFPNVQLVITMWSGKGQTLRDDWQEGGRCGR